MGVVVVGVDGSDAPVDALRFAAFEARLREIPLRVVCGWKPAVVGNSPVRVTAEPFELAARDTIDATMTAVGSELADIEVEPIVAAGGGARGCSSIAPTLTPWSWVRADAAASRDGSLDPSASKWSYTHHVRSQLSAIPPKADHTIPTVEPADGQRAGPRR
jgi:hypothetical protein